MTPEQIHDLIGYNHETGALVWKPRPLSMFPPGPNQVRVWRGWTARDAGKPVKMARHAKGYWVVGILGQRYLVHRVVWALAHGTWPVGEVDHINGDTSDNRVSNLRDIPKAENQRNMKRSKANTSGVTGVCFDRRRGTWYFQISADGRVSSKTGFRCRTAAAVARKLAERRHGYHENHGRVA